MSAYNVLELAFVGAAVVCIIIGLTGKSRKKKANDNFVAQFKQQHPFVDAAAGVMITDYEEVVVNRDTTFKLWKVKDIAYVNVDSSLNRVSQAQRYMTFLDADRNVMDGQLFAPPGAVVENYQNSNHISVVGDNQVRDVYDLVKRHNTYIKLLKDGVEQV